MSMMAQNTVPFAWSISDNSTATGIGGYIVVMPNTKLYVVSSLTDNGHDDPIKWAQALWNCGCKWYCTVAPSAVAQTTGRRVWAPLWARKSTCMTASVPWKTLHGAAVQPATRTCCGNGRPPVPIDHKMGKISIYS